MSDATPLDDGGASAVGPDVALAPLQVSVVRLPEGAPDWDLVAAYLRLRKEVFIDRMAWALNHFRGVEYEQYDLLDTVYVVAHRGREVVGGARLNPTTARIGTGRHTYSYMIRDACLGLLDGMPTTLCDGEPPVDPDVWELTRLATIRAPAISEAILVASDAYLGSIGARQCLFLGPPAFLRMAKRMGWNPEALGPIAGNHDGRFVAFSCDVQPAR